MGAPPDRSRPLAGLSPVEMRGATSMATTAPGALPAPPVLDMDPYSHANLENPYPFFERMRELSSVVRLKSHDTCAVGRYDEVAEVVKDWGRFTTSAGIGLADITKPGSWGRLPSAILETDPPNHTRIRNAVNRMISPIIVRGWRPEFERKARACIDRILDLREFDGVEEIAEPYVLDAFTGAVGLRMTREQAVVVGDWNFNQLGPNNDILAASAARLEPMMAWYKTSITRETLIPGGISDQIYAAADAGQIEPELAPELIRSFIRGGMDTTMSGVGTVLRLFAEHPDQWAIVRADPSKVRAAFEEAIRLETPFQMSYRTTVRDMDFAGHHLAKGTKIAAFFASANRDPRKFPNPDTFDVLREGTRHLAFGEGIHVCIGQNIARLEVECLLTELVRRVKTIALTGAPRYRLTNTLRTLGHLPLRVVGV